MLLSILTTDKKMGCLKLTYSEIEDLPTLRVEHRADNFLSSFQEKTYPTKNLRVVGDHLGNGRVWWTFNSTTTQPEIIQQADYYPFGMKHADPTSMQVGLVNSYMYSGKELNDDFNLDWYDYGARMYNPQIARWNAIDPLAEIYLKLSPYHFGDNNPIINVDIDGRSFWKSSFLNANVGYSSVGLGVTSLQDQADEERQESEKKKNLLEQISSYFSKGKERKNKMINKASLAIEDALEQAVDIKTEEILARDKGQDEELWTSEVEYLAEDASSDLRAHNYGARVDLDEPITFSFEEDRASASYFNVDIIINGQVYKAKEISINIAKGQSISTVHNAGEEGVFKSGYYIHFYNNSGKGDGKGISLMFDTQKGVDAFWRANYINIIQEKIGDGK